MLGNYVETRPKPMKHMQKRPFFGNHPFTSHVRGKVLTHHQHPSQAHDVRHGGLFFDPWMARGMGFAKLVGMLSSIPSHATTIWRKKPYPKGWNLYEFIDITECLPHVMHVLRDFKRRHVLSKMAAVETNYKLKISIFELQWS